MFMAMVASQRTTQLSGKLPSVMAMRLRQRIRDFLELSLLHGAPPKVVLLRVGNVTTARLEHLLRLRADRVRQFALDPDEAVLIVDR
jgi:predicted nuclease of predicted toxin-antitoxin system